MILFLTSSPIGIYRSEEPPDYKGFNPANGMTDELRRYWKNDSRCLLISAFPDEYDVNDRMREDFEGIVRDTGLSLSCMDICDLRNGREKADALSSYDFVILGGGHVPTENAFFRSIGLAERFHGVGGAGVCEGSCDSNDSGGCERSKGSGSSGSCDESKGSGRSAGCDGFNGIVMGISAGTMNCARVVYAQPEMPGEASDSSYERFIPGLGLTEYNLIPHYNAVKNDLIDGQRLFEDIAFGDSRGRTFYAITDGSYLLQTDECAEIRGETYMIRDGKMERISKAGEVYKLL